MAPKSDSPPSGAELRNGYSLSPIARNGAGVTLAISGEIDIANAEAFTDEVHSLVEGADCRLPSTFGIASSSTQPASGR